MAKFLWNHLRIKPSWEPERLSPIEEALEWQERFFGFKKDRLDKHNFIFTAEHEPGQLTCYMVIDLAEIGHSLDSLCKVIQEVISDCDCKLINEIKVVENTEHDAGNILRVKFSIEIANAAWRICKPIAETLIRKLGGEEK